MYLLADLLLQAGTFAEASKTVKESLTREPHSAAALNLSEKIATVQQPAGFNVAGSYKIEYVNDQSHDAQQAELVIEGNAKGPVSWEKHFMGTTPTRCNR